MQLENRDFFCTAEWHFAKLGKYEGLVYAHALHVTSAAPRNRRYYPAINKIAAYYGADPKTIRKAIHKLVQHGFFVVLAKKLASLFLIGLWSIKNGRRGFRGVALSVWKCRGMGNRKTRL